MLEDHAAVNSASCLSAQRYGRLASSGLNTQNSSNNTTPTIKKSHFVCLVIVLLFQLFVLLPGAHRCFRHQRHNDSASEHAERVMDPDTFW